jgi:hypothetical protein
MRSSPPEKYRGLFLIFWFVLFIRILWFLELSISMICLDLDVQICNGVGSNLTEIIKTLFCTFFLFVLKS